MPFMTLRALPPNHGAGIGRDHTRGKRSVLGRVPLSSKSGVVKLKTVFVVTMADVTTNGAARTIKAVGHSRSPLMALLALPPDL